MSHSCNMNTQSRIKDSPCIRAVLQVKLLELDTYALIYGALEDVTTVGVGGIRAREGNAGEFSHHARGTVEVMQTRLTCNTHTTENLVTTQTSTNPLAEAAFEAKSL